MPLNLTRRQKMWLALVIAAIFLGAVCLAGLIAWYGFRGVDGADELTRLLATLLKRRGPLAELFPVLLAALPALAMLCCISRGGDLTNFGQAIVGLLIAVLILALPSAVFIESSPSSPESPEVAVQVIEAAKDLVKFALTYVFMLLGLNSFAELSEKRPDESGRGT